MPKSASAASAVCVRMAIEAVPISTAQAQVRSAAILTSATYGRTGVKASAAQGFLPGAGMRAAQFFSGGSSPAG